MRFFLAVREREKVIENRKRQVLREKITTGNGNRASRHIGCVRHKACVHWFSFTFMRCLGPLMSLPKMLKFKKQKKLFLFISVYLVTNIESKVKLVYTLYIL